MILMVFNFKRMKKITLILLFSLLGLNTYSQNTVGIINNTANSYNGYTLFTLYTQTYLINNCGEVVNQWSSAYPPGNAVYLLENGNLLRAGKTNSTNINFGGVGGRVELFDWDGNLIWGIDYDTPTQRQHHDVYPMPNGNILILVATTMTQAEAIQAGRDPNLLPDGILYNEQIIEIEPLTSNTYNVVWEWNIKDHLIQDFDNTKNNFGVVSDNPQLIDINFLNGLNGSANWIHSNSIQYNEDLDQILISSRNLSEIYIIDHSTTTTEAMSNSGGLYGKGGDFLYRWGNPQSYKTGTENDRKLYGQHHPHWIDNGFADENKIILFNNGNGRTPSFSEVFILNQPVLPSGNYSFTPGQSYLPLNPDYIYTANNFFSAILSSAQRLPNGNTLICEGRTGELVEIDNNDNIVWEYVTPVNNSTGEIFSQGNPSTANLTFRAIRYGEDYPAFIGRDVTPSAPIELNPTLNNCTILSLPETTFNENDTVFHPNPVTDLLYIESDLNITKVEIYNVTGQKVKEVKNKTTINLENINSGILFLKVYNKNGVINKKVVKL